MAKVIRPTTLPPGHGPATQHARGDERVYMAESVSEGKRGSLIVG
jgi:hypothetical protein